MKLWRRLLLIVERILNYFVWLERLDWRKFSLFLIFLVEIIEKKYFVFFKYLFK